MSKTHLVTAIALVLLKNFSANAEPVKQCDYKNYADKVKEFRAKELAAQKLLDQKKAPEKNSAPPPIQVAATQPEAPNGPKTKTKDPLELKIVINQLLASTSLSDRFKMEVINSPDNLEVSLSIHFFGDSAPSWPWPPDQAKSPISKVSPEDFQAKLKAVIGDKKYQSLLDLFPPVEKPQVYQDSEPKHESELQENQIFKFVQNSLKDLILKGRPESALTNSEKAMIQRLETIKLVSFKSAADYKDACELNATHYDDRGHFAVICGKLSEAKQVSLLVESMSSQLSPCESQFSIYEIDVAEYKKLIAQYEGAASSRFPDGFFHIGNHIAKGAAKTGLVDGHTFEQELSDGEGIRDFLLKKGVLKEKVPGTEFKNYALQDTLRCYSSAENGFTQPTEYDFQKYTESIVQNRKHLAGSFYNADKDRKDIRNALHAHPHCNSEGPFSQMNDVISTWAKARVLNRYFSMHPDQENLRAFAESDPNKLTNDSNPLSYYEPKHPSFNDVVESAVRARTAASFGLTTKQTYENFYLQAPAIRKALNCTDIPAPKCFGEDGPTRNVHSSPLGDVK